MPKDPFQREGSVHDAAVPGSASWPSPFRSAPAGGGFPRSSLETLCPQLVVPEDSECTLIMPRMPRSEGDMMIFDSRGGPVFQVIIEGGSHKQSQRGLILSSPNREAEFARALEYSDKVGAGPATKSRLAMLDADGRLHGFLEGESPGANGCLFQYIPNAGHRTRFQRNASGERFEVKYEDGKLLAMVEPTSGGILDPSNENLSVIIGPSVDAGLMVLCLMGSCWLRRENSVL